MKLGAFTCWLSDRPFEDVLIEEAPGTPWRYAALARNEGRSIDAALR
jgi:hypothetical protein